MTRFKGWIRGAALAAILAVLWWAGWGRQTVGPRPGVERKTAPPSTQADRLLILQQEIDKSPPTTIYGQALDWDGEPVSGVNIVLTSRNLYRLLGLPSYEELSATTDADGNFQVRIDKAMFASIKSVAKPGYVYKPVSGEGSYLLQKNISPENRARLLMRKLGSPEFLLIYPMNNSDGERVLKTIASESKVTEWSAFRLDSYREFWPEGADLQISVRFDEKEKDWEIVYRAFHPDGGVYLSKKELFMAPEEGYQRELRLRAGGVSASKRRSVYHLYIKTRNPQVYTKVFVEERAGLPDDYPTCSFELSFKSWTNPYGERNFEPLKRTAENFQAQDAHTEYCLQCINEGRRADPKHLADLLAKPVSTP